MSTSNHVSGARPPIVQRLFSLHGRVDRTSFVLLGLTLFATKALIDWSVAKAIFNRSWSLYNYLSQTQVTLLAGATTEDGPYYASMLGIALPFVWAGVAITVKRLRSAGLPIWLAFLFFVPTINVFFILALCVKAPQSVATDEPTSPEPTVVAPLREFHGSFLDALGSVFLAALLGVLLTGFNVYAIGAYGLGLFVGLPFCVGLIAAVLYGHRNPRGLGGCVEVSIGSLFLCGVSLLFVGAEGLICLFMATPIWLGCGVLGGYVGYEVQMHARDRLELAIIVVALVFGVPILMGAEAVLLPEAPTLSVTSTLDVEAPPSEVWAHVIAFPKLEEPDHWAFRAGVAYPIGARIVGHGPGAIRHCDFSTGSFEEPIKIWDEPRHLQFSVTHNPPPMRELSFLDDVHPPHLDGFLVSRAGEFVLTELPDGTTRLSGTTWYQHSMWPASYWQLWSDYLIHQIHFQVLEHVKGLSEGDRRP